MASCDPTPLPEPTWLAGCSHPLIDALLVDLSDETRRLYHRNLAFEVRAQQAHGSPAWRAFDLTLLEVLRRRRESREQ